MPKKTRGISIFSYIVSSLNIPAIYYIVAVGIFTGVFYFTKQLSLSLLFAYAFLVFSETVLARNAVASTETHWIPFWFLWSRSPRSWPGGFSQVAANMIMFIPIGFFLSYILNYPQRVMLISCFFSSCLEILQFLLHRGVCETDDVIGNTLGAFLGYLIYLGLCWLKAKYQTRKHQS